MPRSKVKPISFKPYTYDIWVKARILQLKSQFAEMGFVKGVAGLVAEFHPEYNNPKGIAHLRQALEGRVCKEEIIDMLEATLVMLDREDNPEETVRKLPNQDVA